LVAEVKCEPLRVLDIGCGDGALLAKVMESRRVSHAVALDGSAAMLQRARERFAKNDDVKFVQADFNIADWTAKLSDEKFDAVVSGFAIHHSEDEQKRRVYEQIFQLLAPGSVFVNIEHVASATPFGERLWDRAWTEYDVAYRRANGEQIEFDAALAEFLAGDQRAANRLTPVETQLQWLREIGFADVDCYCKYLELAVLAGYRR
jgi:ubiquinone/menaquinone biosynthesis C-methylase UbiE